MPERRHWWPELPRRRRACRRRATAIRHARVAAADAPGRGLSEGGGAAAFSPLKRRRRT